MNLRNHVESLPGNPILVVSPHGELTRDQVLCHDIGIREKLAGARVGIYVADPGKALQMLVGLDGVADVVALLSPVAAPEFVVKMASRCGLEAVLCDAPDSFTTIKEALPAFRSLDALAASRIPVDLAAKTRWVLTTSGTTSEPKLVSHTLASLTRTTKLDAVRGASVRWGMLYDHTRFAGLQVLLQSVLSGSTLVSPALSDKLEQKVEKFIRHNCTHLSGTPTLWRKIIMTPGAERLQPQQITLGGEIADDRILATLAAFYPNARLVHIYASTEAGVGFSVADKRSGFPASYLTAPPAGIGIKVENDRLYVRNPHVCPHYLDTPDSFAGEDGWVDTGDVVEVQGDRVQFLGRANGVINVGGDKVHPEEVERVLMAHPLVAIARVYGKSNPITGALVAADIVLASPGMEAKDASEALRKYTQAELGRRKAPALIRIVAGFDLNIAGKIARN
jgi:acyl-CoA synthetase (AMP-forming)/AMP-acid ligase II